jgi:phosphoribosylformylglycinamidine synthase
VIVLLGEGRDELGGSQYLETLHDLVRGMPPTLNLDTEKALQGLMVNLAAERLVHSAHDCSDGGLAVTLAECCFDTGGAGAEVSIEALNVGRDSRLNDAVALFGESASRVVVSVSPDHVTEILQRAALAGVLARVIGETGGNRLRIAVAGRVIVDVSVDDAERVWSTAIEHVYARKVA